MAETSAQLLVTASAPGKIVLAGEYAVLDGAPAICMAVDRRARVTISTSTEDHHTVIAPGLTNERGRFVARDGEITWIAAGEKFALLDEVWRTANARSRTPMSLLLDSREFVAAGSGTKIGSGSSAALTVALAAALCELADTTGDAVSVAFAAHRQFQGGLGSGADVACSIAGGIIEYRMVGNETRSTDWPAGLEHALLWSGVPVSTGRKIRHLAAQKTMPSRAALGIAARRLAKAWRKASTHALLGEFHDYTRTLREFSIDHELGIFDAGHAELAVAAEAAGVVYKPCGAGGGDLGIVLADSEAAIASFVGKALPRNFQVLNMNVDPHGMRVARGAN
jgi:phosphomevalonate kinase